MFKECPLLALIETKKNICVVKRISEDRDSQTAIDKTFENAVLNIRQNRSEVIFDGKYIPQSEDMEVLVIHDFILPTVIREALKNPQGLEVYSPVDGKLPPIKALFVGKYSCVNGEEMYTVAFQKFRNDQYITATRHHLFFTENTFVKDNRVGLTVAMTVDCVYEQGSLYFPSYYFAKQIFDLTNYYRIASTQDIQSFINNPLISMKNSEEFINSANTWERRKIASINDSGVLQNYTARKIKTLGENNGVEILVSNGSIMLPEDRTERRIVLGFLDEEVYKGVFSQTLFQTNSKKKAK